MPKGRQFTPSTERVGIWFEHRGTDDGRPLCREKSTTTGNVLTSPFRAETCNYPPDPPCAYKAKDTKVFNLCNKFSEHDNREILRDDGEIFGAPGQRRTLGKKLVSDPDHDMHHTEQDMLTHYDRLVTCYDYNTTYAGSYSGCPTGSAPNCRKFPRRYPDPLPGVSPLKTWSCIPNEVVAEEACRETVGLMAITQRPPDHNCSWKYSYRGLPRCYPGGISRIDASNPYPGWFMKNPSRTTLPTVNNSASRISAVSS